MTATDRKPDEGEIRRLLEIMATLRDRGRGCPWDLEQTFETIAPYTIEEAYEVADAIERGDLGALEDELGDLLFQVVFHSRIAEEQGAFEFADVTRRICEKMVRRHPHVFAGERIEPGRHADAWEASKRRERGHEGSLLDGIAPGLPALTRAVKLGKRAGRAGFDWPNARGPREKIDEELRELDEAIASGDQARMAEELGDVLFALANLARHLGVDPEQSARGANRRFETRFRYVEACVERSGRPFDAHSLDELEAYWQAAKKAAEGKDGA
ncbi:MAG: nucleoside triphosphate pyrophosphohydrolase [Gammaproteobacteria bacterium]|nr:nucleoside triphosphate pyrophosphohydrolase [Gammaproteobacteria bacterium]